MNNFKNTLQLKQDEKGFTLVELLVVIAIIAILAVVGVTVFSGTQKTARDSRRKADIDAMATAYETNFNTTTANQYIPLTIAMFASGAVPTDPGTYSYANLLAGGGLSFTVCAQLENTTTSSNGSNSSVNTAGAPNGTAGIYYCKKNQQS